MSLPFVTVDRASGRAVGSTRYMNIEATHRRLESGTTWIGKSFQRTPIDTEAKYLMLRHAFETLDCIAVDLRTHEKNTQSRAAIERLGACCAITGSCRTEACAIPQPIRSSPPSGPR